MIVTTYLISCSFVHLVQLSISIIISHGSGKLLVIHSWIILPLSPQPGNSLVRTACLNDLLSFYSLGIEGSVIDKEDSLLLIVPGDNTGIVLRVAE